MMKEGAMDETFHLPLEQVRPDPRALEIVQHLRQAGFAACFAGGCVRDILLGKRPQDWDIATSARPEQIETLFARTIPVGKAFGVMLVVIDEMPFEVATFRGDSPVSDGRRPASVRFTDAREDVLRRDFTINALLYDPESETVLDFVGGRRDLEQRLIRTVGDPEERFREDHLRLLRAIRFAAGTGFGLEPATLAAIRRLAPLAAQVSAERTGQELTRMFSEGNAARALARLADSGLLAIVLPELDCCRGIAQPPEFHPEGDVFEHTVKAAGGLDEVIRDSDRELAGPLHPWLTATGRIFVPDPADRETLAWAVLLHDIGKPATFFEAADRIRFHGHETAGAGLAAAVLQRLRRPVKLAETVAALVAAHMRLPAFPEMRVATRRRTLQDPLFPLHWLVLSIDTQASCGQPELPGALLAAWIEELRRPRPVKPLLTGRDLLRLGYIAGPVFAELLEAVETARLEGEILTAAEAAAWVLSHHPSEKALKNTGQGQ
jgi:poly(A) polymerase